MKVYTIHYYETKRKQALSNMRRQRVKQQLGKNVRVPSSFWERVASDYSRQIGELKKRLPCECGSEEFFLAPIVHIRCYQCKRPL